MLTGKQAATCEIHDIHVTAFFDENRINQGTWLTQTIEHAGTLDARGLLIGSPYQWHQMQLFGGLLPCHLSLATESPGDSIQVANDVKDMGVLMDNSFSPSIHCKEAASKARRMLFMIRRAFAEPSVSAFAPLM